MAVRCGFVLKLFKFFFAANSTWTYYSDVMCPQVGNGHQMFTQSNLLSNDGLSDANKCGILVNINNIVIKLLLLQETN